MKNCHITEQSQSGRRQYVRPNSIFAVMEVGAVICYSVGANTEGMPGGPDWEDGSDYHTSNIWDDPNDFDGTFGEL